MATKNKPGKYDCYQNADPDEPMFVLLARDKHAPALIWLWRVLRELDGEEPEKLKEAGTCAVEMMLWQKDHGRKAVGVTQAVLAGILEMTRVINNTKEEFHNDKTDEDVFRRYMCFAAMEPAAEDSYQQRAIDEKAQLDEKIDKLTAFRDGDKFSAVDPDEQQRLRDQLMAMREYSHILAERIIHFPK